MKQSKEHKSKMERFHHINECFTNKKKPADAVKTGGGGAASCNQHRNSGGSATPSGQKKNCRSSDVWSETRKIQENSRNFTHLQVF